MKQMDFNSVVAVMANEVLKRPGRDAKLVIEELWSEAFTLGQRGSAMRWQYVVFNAEREGKGEYWYKRVRNAILRRLRGAQR